MNSSASRSLLVLVFVIWLTVSSAAAVATHGHGGAKRRTTEVIHKQNATQVPYGGMVEMAWLPSRKLITMMSEKGCVPRCCRCLSLVYR